ncbi:hypothetical protein [Streptomyces flaveus]|uniref:hypothetical protein n=1 Tax=Streptomyces flaveus TaxID=66370 RepID=UPI0016704A3A|nr:hypothetical protein [Streptomyces flaveus]
MAPVVADAGGELLQHLLPVSWAGAGEFRGGGTSAGSGPQPGADSSRARPHPQGRAIDG